MAFKLTSELLMRGLDDWLQLSEVVSVVRSLASIDDPLLLKQRVLDVTFEVMRHGLMEAGEFDGYTFQSWSLNPEDAFVRIRQRWDELGQMPGLGDVCWLANTAEGDRLAKKLRETHLLLRKETEPW